MTELHARLLVRCDPAWYGLRDDPPRAFAALEAAVKLHVPDVESPWACDHCSTLEIPWPCSTIRVIAEQLGVPVDDAGRRS